MKYLISSLIVITSLIGCKSDYIEQIPEEAIGKWELKFRAVRYQGMGQPIFYLNGTPKVFDTTSYTPGNYIILESDDNLVFENSALEREECHYFMKDEMIVVRNKFSIHITSIEEDTLRIEYEKIDLEYSPIIGESLSGILELVKVNE